MGHSMRVAGDIIHGRYRVVRALGEGAFAQVYQGEDLTLGREVAIKMMRLSILDHPGARGDALRRDLMERFHREAMVVAQLRAESTVTLYDFGAEPNGDMFMVLEYVGGRTLRQEVQERGRMSAERVAHILKQALRSLFEAHAYDLLHRDIKPENLMIFDYLGESDKLRLLDFGIAKTLQERASVATASGLLMGTPRYIPPERVTMNSLVPASDLYSLGGVAYYLLTGEELYPDIEGAMLILQHQVSGESVRVPEWANVPVALARIVDKMLEKELSKRYSSAQEVERDVDAYLFYTTSLKQGFSGGVSSAHASVREEPLLQEAPFMGDDSATYEQPMVRREELMSFGAEPVAQGPSGGAGAHQEGKDTSPTEVVEFDPDMFE